MIAGTFFIVIILLALLGVKSAREELKECIETPISLILLLIAFILFILSNPDKREKEMKPTIMTDPDGNEFIFDDPSNI